MAYYKEKYGEGGKPATEGSGRNEAGRDRSRESRGNSRPEHGGSSGGRGRPQSGGEVRRPEAARNGKPQAGESRPAKPDNAEKEPAKKPGLFSKLLGAFKKKPD
jgi:hypothetical protein